MMNRPSRLLTVWKIAFALCMLLPLVCPVQPSSNRETKRPGAAR